MYYNKSQITTHEKKAEELFLSGYNCAQSVFAAFSDLTGISVEDSARIASAFGGGMSGKRSVCGTVTGMMLVLGNLKGYSDGDDREGKVALYADGKALLDEFEEIFGTLICRELLVGRKLSPTPAVRTEEYYASRPCASYCAVAANILDNYLASAENKA